MERAMGTVLLSGTGYIQLLCHSQQTHDVSDKEKITGRQPYTCFHDNGPATDLLLSVPWSVPHSHGGQGSVRWPPGAGPPVELL